MFSTELFKTNTKNGLIWQKIENETGISRIDLERDFIEELNNEE